MNAFSFIDDRAPSCFHEPSPSSRKNNSGCVPKYKKRVFGCKTIDGGIVLGTNTKTNSAGIKALYTKEDSWAVWIGFAAILFALVLWAAGSDMRTILVPFSSYDNFNEVPAMVVPLLPNIFLLYLLLLLSFGMAMGIMGYDIKAFIKGFSLLFIIAFVVQVLGSWSVAVQLSFETPLIALIVGMVIGNFVRIPDWFDAAMRTEFYVKTGIVLMGATLPFALILHSGPLAIGQALCMSLVTFVVIYVMAAHVLKLEKPFAATLGVGGSVCGISASIAIASSVNAKKSHVSMALSMVVIWAIVMAFLLPVACRALGLASGVAGAWIGSSEFADAAGMVAAAQFGEDALTTFTLVKVLGRDIFIGFWAFVLAIVSVTIWEAKKGGNEGCQQKPSATVMWERFPKFVIGFLIASIIISAVSLGAGNSSPLPLDSAVIQPIKGLRDWAFTLCFLCIGMTTRFKDLASMGWKPFAAFSTGVAVNFALGFFLSAGLFAEYWIEIGL